MLFPKLRSLMATGVSKEQRDCLHSILRWGLLVWAVLRLAVSSLFTTAVLMKTFMDIRLFRPEDDTHRRLDFDIFAILVQVVEFGMIVTFIIAGIKKSASLYRTYFYYCIVTLIVYVTVVIMGFFVFYDDHDFAEVYLTFHLNSLPITNPDIEFIVIAAIDVVLEILLIFSIKKLIRRYTLAKSENVKTSGV